MKKSLLIAAALAATSLTACSSGDDTATSSVSPSSSAAAPSSADQATGTGDASSTGGTLVLDEQTTTWFATFCTGFTGLRDSFASVQSDLAGTTGTTPQEKQTAVAAVVTDLGTKLKGLATDTGAVPPPTIENGQSMATAAVDGFNGIGDAMIGAADQFAQTPITDEASLQAAATQLQTALQDEATKAQTAFSAIDMESQPGLDEAIGAIPECSDMAS